MYHTLFSQSFIKRQFGYHIHVVDARHCIVFGAQWKMKMRISLFKKANYKSLTKQFSCLVFNKSLTKSLTEHKALWNCRGHLPMKPAMFNALFSLAIPQIPSFFSLPQYFNWKIFKTFSLKSKFLLVVKLPDKNFWGWGNFLS